MAGMYTKLVSHFLFPIHEYLKGHNSVALMRLMEQSQWWDRDELRSYQDQRVKRLLLHSYEHVPYYRRIMRRQGIVVADIQGLDELPRIPFLDKQNVRVNINALKADDARGLARFNTGGSSGEPLIFYIGRERVSHDVAAKWRAMRWWDVDIGDPEIVVWGSPIELGAQDRIRAIRDRLMRTRLLAAFEMSPTKFGTTL